MMLVVLPSVQISFNVIHKRWCLLIGVVSTPWRHSHAYTKMLHMKSFPT